jgi:hypothetical protein
LNPLDKIKENYKNNTDAFKVIKACVSETEGPLRDALASTSFTNLSGSVAIQVIGHSEEQLEYLTVLALFSTFERHLRDALAANASLLAGAQPASSLATSLPQFYESQCDFFGIMRVVELFKPDVDDNLIKRVKMVKDYRDWIAHGRSSASAPKGGIVFALTAYDILTAFLTKAHLI